MSLMCFSYLVVIDGIVHRRISLHGDGHRHERRRGHHDHLEWEQDIGKEVNVEVADEVKALAEALQDGAGQVADVEDGQGDQHEVEAVAHLLRGQDERRAEIAEDPTACDRGLNHSLKPEC